MNYEAWRVTYQDSEQAASAAFKRVCELSSEVKELKNDKLAQDAAYNAMMAQRDVAELRAERLLQEARGHAGEARTQRRTVYDIYKVCGAQKGDWNGAQPVIDKLDEVRAQRDYLDGVIRESYGWIEGDTEVLLRDLLHGQVGYYEMYESVERLRIIIGHGLKYICSGYDENEKQA